MNSRVYDNGGSEGLDNRGHTSDLPQEVVQRLMKDYSVQNYNFADDTKKDTLVSELKYDANNTDFLRRYMQDENNSKENTGGYTELESSKNFDFDLSKQLEEKSTKRVSIFDDYDDDEEEREVPLVKRSDAIQKMKTGKIPKIEEPKREKPNFGMTLKNMSLAGAVNSILAEEEKIEEEPVKENRNRSEIMDDVFQREADNQRLKAIIESKKEKQKAAKAKPKRKRTSGEIDEDTIDFKSPKVVGLAILTVVLVFTLGHNIYLSARLDSVETELVTYENTQSENEDLKLDVLALEEQLAKAESEVAQPNAENSINQTTNVQLEESATSESATEQPTTPTPTITGDFDTYTVADGDTLWEISQKTLNDGSRYQEILDANGLTEDDYLDIGTELKIPKQ